MSARNAIAIISAVVLAVSLAACGGSGSSGVSPAAYVKSVCEAIGPFEKTVQSRSQALNLSKPQNATDGKKALQGFLTAVASDTDQAVGKLKAAGSPNVANGKQVSQAIVTAFTRLKSALTAAAAKAGTLPTDSPAAFQAGAQALGASVQTSIGGIGTSLGNLKSTDLENAAKKEPACQSLGA
jgi:hypothetical protein